MRSNDDVADRAGKLDSLWDAFVKPLADPELYQQDRVAAATQVMQQIRTLAAQTEGDTDKRAELAFRAIAILQLFAADTLDWLEDAVFDFMPPPTNLSNAGMTERARALAFLHLSEGALHAHQREAATLSLIPLPRSTSLAVAAGLSALLQGEVQDIFAPTQSGKHGDSWSWDLARVRAIEHVLFLNGQGVQKRIARQRVATAMTNVSTDTLKDWEERKLLECVGAKHAFDDALAAGKLAGELKVNPDAWSLTNAVDHRVALALRTLESQSVPDFGRRYHEMHGHRHRGVGKGGD